jgi:hypothetical protein
MSRTRKFRPAAECLETRMVLNGNMGPDPVAVYTPAEQLGILTNQVSDLYAQANQNVQSSNALVTSMNDQMRQYDIDHVSQRLSDVENNLEQAKTLAAQDHSLAQQVQQLAVQERALKAKHPHLKDRAFRAVVTDMQTLDTGVTQLTDPGLVKTEAWLNGALNPTSPGSTSPGP